MVAPAGWGADGMTTKPGTADGQTAAVQCQPVAPAWHTAGVAILVVGLAALGPLHLGALLRDGLAHLPGIGPLLAAMTPRQTGYVFTLSGEWLIFAFIWLGVRLQGVPFSAVTGAMPWRASRLVRDLGVALLFLLAAGIVLNVTGHLLHAVPAAALKTMLPQSLADKLLFAVLALTAGVCEETIFRGYLQRQLTAWLGSRALGLLLQAVLFGAAHIYQGYIMVVQIAVFGVMFGLLALWRKNLRPGMIAHFVQDAVSGLLLARYIVK
jgi:uncharacterized protein